MKRIRSRVLFLLLWGIVVCYVIRNDVLSTTIVANAAESEEMSTTDMKESKTKTESKEILPTDDFTEQQYKDMALAIMRAIKDIYSTAIVANTAESEKKTTTDMKESKTKTESEEILPTDDFTEQQYKDMALAVMRTIKWEYRDRKGVFYEYVFEDKTLEDMTNIKIAQIDGSLGKIQFEVDGKTIVGSYDYLYLNEGESIYPTEIGDMIDDLLFKEYIEPEKEYYLCNDWDEAKNIIGYAWCYASCWCYGEITDIKYDEIIKNLSYYEKMNSK